MLTVYIIRHGQTDHNLKGLLQGHLNTPLNATGHAQAKLIAKRLIREECVRFDLAFTSDSDRAKDTAVAIVREHGDGLVLQPEEGLRERDLGELSGKPGPVPRPLPPSVESSEALNQRCVKWWRDTIVSLAKQPEDRTVLIVTHSGYIVNLLRQLVETARHGGLNYAVKGQALREHPFRSCKNTGIAVVTVDQAGNGTVERYNDHAHLKRGMSLVESRDVVA